MALDEAIPASSIRADLRVVGTGGKIVRRENGLSDGRMAEWFKAAVLKTAVGASPP